MDKLGDPGTIAGGTALLTSIASLIYTTNKINEVRQGLDEVTGHLATTIGEKGTLDKMNQNIENLGRAIKILNNNIGEIVTVINEEQRLRAEQLTAILGILKELSDVPEETSKLLTQKVMTGTRIHRIEPTMATTDVNQMQVRNGISDSLGKPNPDRRATLRSLGLHS